jgi:ABC-type lipoprotein release transport system permease subunit
MVSKRFILPKTISPFYGDMERIPRKLKKELNKNFVWKSKTLTLGQKLWYNLNVRNHNYVRFLIMNICEYEQTKEIKSV